MEPVRVIRPDLNISSNLALLGPFRRPIGCDPWRDAFSIRSVRLLSACECESRASCTACGCWVEMFSSFELILQERGMP